jgi:holo-[acyl-carrier protein] synthase
MNEREFYQSITGIGTDIIEISRIQEAIERHGERFLSRIFTLREREYCERYAQSTPHYAGRFAAKEAIVKALGTGFQFEMTWQDIEVINNPLGKPEVILSPQLRKTFPTAIFFLSISHCNKYATATTIVVS